MEEVDLLSQLDGTERGVVVMMCGLPGSGKSTYAQALERRGYTRLSIDEVVWARIGRDAADLDPAEYEQLKSAIEQELWEELLRLWRRSCLSSSTTASGAGPPETDTRPRSRATAAGGN